jgi:hypothetical protein
VRGYATGLMRENDIRMILWEGHHCMEVYTVCWFSVFRVSCMHPQIDRELLGCSFEGLNICGTLSHNLT